MVQLILDPKEVNFIVDSIQTDNLSRLRSFIERTNLDLTLFLQMELQNMSLQRYLGQSGLCYARNMFLQNQSLLRDVNTYLSRPLGLAAGSGATQVLSWLWEFAGVDETSGILHSVFTGLDQAIIDETVCVAMVRTVRELCGLQSHEIFLNENINGLRPLETACQSGAYAAMLEILETPGVYKLGEVTVGPHRLCTFDLSEYSPNNHSVGRKSRYWLSPLRILTSSPVNFIDKFESSDILNNPIIYHWITRTYYRTLLFCSSCAIITLTIAVVWPTLKMAHSYRNAYANYINLDNDSFDDQFLACKEKPALFTEWQRLFILDDHLSLAKVISWCTILFYTWQVLNMTFWLIRERKYEKQIQNQNWKTTRNPRIINTTFMVIVKYLLCVTVFMSHFKDFTPQADFADEANLVFTDAFSLCTTLLIYIDLLRYLSIVETFGSAVHMFLISLETILPFFTIYAGAICLHGLLFLQQMPCLQFPRYFSNWFLSACFVAFRLTLNVLDFEVKFTNRLWLLQISLVFFVAIFIVNFVVAFISHRVGLISKHPDLFVRLNKLQLCLEFEVVYRIFPLNFMIARCFPNCCRERYRVIMPRRQNPDYSVSQSLPFTEEYPNSNGHSFS